MMTNYIFKEQIIQIYAQEFINEHNYIVNKKSNAHIKKNNNVQNYSRTTGNLQDSVEDKETKFRNTHEKTTDIKTKNVKTMDIKSTDEKIINKKRLDNKDLSIRNQGENKAANKGKSPWFFIMPVKGGWTSSGFNDGENRQTPHKGQDIAVLVGTDVYAVKNGIVELSYYSQSYGYNVLINHGNNIKTRYAHMSQLNVKVGEKVEQGQIIGLSGNTGDSTGPHLHFELIKNDVKINPMVAY